VHRKAQIDRITKDSMKLCQEGIDQSEKSAQEELDFEFRDKGSVKGRHLHSYLTLCGSARRA
jgi:hypothetical protein